MLKNWKTSLAGAVIAALTLLQHGTGDIKTLGIAALTAFLGAVANDPGSDSAQ